MTRGCVGALVVIALAVILASGVRLAEIIGFVG